METNKSPIASLIEKVEDYGKTSIELTKLTAIDKTSDVISAVISKAVIFVIFALFAFVANIGLSLWIGEMLGKNYYGFFVVAAFYALLALLIHASRKSLIISPVKNSLIAEMLKTKTA